MLWEPGFDDGTAEADLTYEVWASTVPELQNFAWPPNGKVVGGTSVTISGLLPSTDYYVVCRARDASGNQDKNLSQKSARTPADAQPPTFAGLAGIDAAARTVLAALGLAAGALARTDADLRSRCQLFAQQVPVWELLDRPGETPRKYQLSAEAAVSLLQAAIDEAVEAGLPWEGEIVLTPSDDLVELVRRSQELAAATDGGED